jgi:hypothetical protein
VTVDLDHVVDESMHVSDEYHVRRAPEILAESLNDSMH